MFWARNTYPQPVHNYLFFANFIDDQSNTIQGINPMQTDQQSEGNAVFLQTLTRAVTKLKNRLQRDYEQAYPGLGSLIRIVLDEEEAKAWELSFPHLFLPDLVEAHIARLGLKAADTRDENAFAPRASAETQNYQPALAYADC